MLPRAAVRPALVFAAALPLASYFPPSEINGGWRKRTNLARIRELGIEPRRLSQLGQYLMSQPYENYKAGVSGYDPSNKAAIVVKGGRIGGEYYNQTSLLGHAVAGRPLPDDGIGTELATGCAVPGPPAHLQRTDTRLPEGGNRPGVAEERPFDAVTDRYVACDGTVVNGRG